MILYHTPPILEWDDGGIDEITLSAKLLTKKNTNQIKKIIIIFIYTRF